MQNLISIKRQRKKEGERGQKERRKEDIKWGEKRKGRVRLLN